MFTVDDFGITETPPELGGITPQLLWDLYDIGTKFGILQINEGFTSFRFTLKGGEEFSIFSPVETGTRLKFGIGHYEALNERENIIEIPLVDGSIVVWERTFAVDTAKSAVYTIDARALEKGWIDTSNGSRKQTVLFKGNEPRYKVADWFPERHRIWFASSSGFSDSPHDALQEFDQPERLIVLKDPVCGLEGICLKEDEQFFQDKWGEDIETLRQAGMQPEQLTRLSPEDRLEIRASLDEVIVVNDTKLYTRE